MDRREFFRRAGLGAGALLVAPQLGFSSESLPETPAPPKPLKYESGFIYQNGEPIAAIANCDLRLECEIIGTRSWDPSEKEDPTFMQGLPTGYFSGDLLPLGDMNASDLLHCDELLHIVVRFPDGQDIWLEADGLITSINTMVTLHHPLVHGFEFQTSGATTITTN